MAWSLFMARGIEFAFVVFLIISVWKYYKMLKLRWTLNLPGPLPPLPFFGQFLHMLYRRKDLHIWQQELVVKYGPVFLMFWLGRPYICVSDPETIKAIMVRHFASFTDRGAFGFNLPPPYNASVNQATGENWRRIRGTINPAFSTSKTKKMMKFMEEAIDTFVDKIHEATNKGAEPIDVYRWFQGLTLEIVLTTSFGVKAQTQTDPWDPLTHHARLAISRLFSALVVAMLPFGDVILRNLSDPFHFKDLTNIARAIIAERRHQNGKNTRQDLLHLMTSHGSSSKDQKNHHNTTSPGLTDDEILVQSIAFILAGYDTTSSALGFLFYELALHQNIQTKLINEVDQLYATHNKGTFPPYEEILSKTPYMDMVVDEILRLHTPPFFCDRSCTESCTINGVNFPKGINILIPIYAIHMEPKVWKDPTKFDPERFSREQKATRHPYIHMPFGHGPRRCIGLRFALLQIKLVLIKVFREFRVQPTERTMIPLRKDLSILLNCPYDAVMLRFKHRQNKLGKKRSEQNGFTRLHCNGISNNNSSIS